MPKTLSQGIFVASPQHFSRAPKDLKGKRAETPLFDSCQRICANAGGSGANRIQMGSAVVCLISDMTMLELTSWMPGNCESFSKKKRS